MMPQHVNMNRGGYPTKPQDNSVAVIFQDTQGAVSRPSARGINSAGGGGPRQGNSVPPGPHYTTRESFYAEIPAPSSSGSSGPSYMDMKPVEYKQDNLNNGQVRATPRAEPYMNLGPPQGRNRSPQLSDLDSTYYMAPSRTCCSKITTIHVVVMAVSGLVYLILGGVAGYYFAKSGCGSSSCDRDTQTPLPLWNMSWLGFLDRLDILVQRNASVTPSSVAATPWLTNAGANNLTDLPTTTPDPYTMHCREEEQMCACGPFGGLSGRPFTDSADYGSAGNVTDFTVRHNEYFISSLSLTYGGRSGDDHGYAEEGVQTFVSLLNGERIHTMKMDFTEGKQYLTSLMVYTNLRVLGPYGGEGAKTFYARGNKLLYVDGRSGPLVDQLIIYFDKCL